jgi:hypothetical protein
MVKADRGRGRPDGAGRARLPPGRHRSDMAGQFWDNPLNRCKPLNTTLAGQGNEFAENVRRDLFPAGHLTAKLTPARLAKE